MKNNFSLKMSHITQLPTEILEHILLYLTSEDIYSWNEASDLELSDSFWKKTCLRDGVVNEEEEKEISDSRKWREEYFAHLNWKKGNFDRRYFPCIDQPVKIHKSNIFIPCGDKFSVCCIEDSPRFLDDLPTKKVHTFGSYIVLVQGDVVNVYRYSDDVYSHFKTIIVQNKLITISDKKDSECNFTSKNEITVAMNEKYLVTYQHKFKLLTILNLKENDFTHFDTDCSFLFSLNILCNRVYTLLLKCNKYTLNKFNLTSKKWEESVVISQNAAGILVPKLKYNDKIVVSLITFFVSSYNTIKIMNKEGKSLETVQIDANFTWFCLENTHVIYPKAASVIEVWNYNKPETITEINVDQGFITGSTAPTCVLVIVYEHYLDVYNYQDCLKLYRIKFDVPKLTPLINKWYCVLTGSEVKCVSVFDFKKGKQKNYHEKHDFNFKSQAVF